jgi:acyl-coenzyme A thioesterase PaaI-like protein
MPPTTAAEAEDELYFRSIPWCQKLLSDPAYVVIHTPARSVKDSTEDELFAVTLKTEDTIKSYLTTYKRKPEGERITEVRTFLALGYRLNGFPKVVHGGIVATLLDEVLGTLWTANRHHSGSRSANVMTASLKITYLRPVMTPQVVLVTGVLRKQDGRKHFIDGTISDSEGAILAKAESIWIETRKENSSKL